MTAQAHRIEAAEACDRAEQAARNLISEGLEFAHDPDLVCIKHDITKDILSAALQLAYHDHLKQLTSK